MTKLTASQKKILSKLDSGTSLVHHHRTFWSDDDWYHFCTESIHDPERNLNTNSLTSLLKKGYVEEGTAEGGNMETISWVHITEIGRKVLHEQIEGVMKNV